MHFCNGVRMQVGQKKFSFSHACLCFNYNMLWMNEKNMKDFKNGLVQR